MKWLKVIGLVSLIMGFFFVSFFSTANAVLAEEGEKYEITEGNGDLYIRGVDEYLRFTGDGDYFEFTGLEIDGLKVDPDDYGLTGYPTVITLGKGFLDSLSEGLHAITMQWNDGIATGKFIVEVSEASEFSEQTEGDSDDLGLSDIEEIDITVDPPEVGEPMNFNVLNYSDKPEGAVKDFKVYWYVVEEGKRRSICYPGAVFKPGVTYMVAVRADFDRDKFVARESYTVLKVNGQPADEKYSFVDKYYDYVGIAYIWEPQAAEENDPGNAGADSTDKNLSPATGITEQDTTLPAVAGLIGLAVMGAGLVWIRRREQE